MNKTVKKIWNGVTTVLVVVVVLLAILLAGARLAGLQVFTVLSGSMEPTYHVGALLYVKEVDPAELKSGDAITFLLDEDTIVTHRITEVIPDAEDSSVLYFRTKGDANAMEDGSPVHCNNVIGTPVFSIPKLGYLANFIQTPSGTYLSIAVGAVLLLLIFLPDLLGGRGKGKAQS